jgi:competence/damage-inducible protein CinA-like protein
LTAAILTVGTELLRGRIVNTNSAWIAQRLTEIGFDVVFQATVGDELSHIVRELRRAAEDARVVVVTGGLGPTQDDLTRESFAEVTRRPLEIDPEALEHLRGFFAHRGFSFTDNNAKQASRPGGAELLENTCGTAPGLWLEDGGIAYVAVPGPPTEMREMMEREVLPRLSAGAETQAAQRQIRRLRLCDIGESMAADKLRDLMARDRNPLVASYAAPAEVVLEVTARAESEGAATRMLDEVEAVIRERLGAAVFATGEETMEVALGRALREARRRIATAESCTGGLIASRITDVPGASDYFVEGIVSYANEAKMDLLGVPAEMLAEHGAVSEPVARAMAEGVRRRSRADYAIAVTGIAGPAGGTPEKPVGLVFVAVADAAGTVVERFVWPGTRAQFKARVSQTALNMARKRVLGAM